MTDSRPYHPGALDALCAAGYFRHAEDGGAAAREMAREYGLETALFSPASGRAVLLDAEDLAEGGAGMGIQQIRMLLAMRGIAIDAADSEESDGDATCLLVDGSRALLFDWSFNKRPMPDDLAGMACENALRDLLWKARVQGHDLATRPCEHGSPGVDLHLQWHGGSRFLAHWGFGFDDGQVLFAVNFFTLVNRLLAQRGAAERLYAWQPFTGGQIGVLLSAPLFAQLHSLNLAGQLRRIDAID